MSRTIGSQKHEALRAFIVEKRKAAGLRQVDVAKRMRRYQSYITHIETGQKEIGVVELLELSEAIGFDPREAIKRLLAMSR
jgi:transcriptional regulator with XRE-family HTH domain